MKHQDMTLTGHVLMFLIMG